MLKKIIAPWEGSEISHLISELLPMPHFPKSICHSSCIQVLDSRKDGLNASLKGSKTDNRK